MNDQNYLYILAAGTISFYFGDELEKENLEQTVVNCLVKTQKLTITLSVLREIQEKLQMRLVNDLHNVGADLNKFHITNVVMNSILPLGLMSDKEFNDIEIPEELKEQVKTAN